jgi:hypothetical protein
VLQGGESVAATLADWRGFLAGRIFFSCDDDAKCSYRPINRANAASVPFEALEVLFPLVQVA